jgi:type IV secretion system protein TrbJ
MKFTMKNHRRWAIGGAVLLLTATPSFAIFGLGDIVFDPTSYASLVSQATTALNQLKTIENNVTHFSFKQQWQTVLNTLKNANVKNMFGETNGMSNALNTNSPSASSTAWTAATISLDSDAATYLQGMTPGSTRLSQLAMIEASDSVSPDCLTAIGQYRSARSQNAAATSSLATEQIDGSDATNSEVEQLNLLNAAEAQKMSEMQTQGVLQTCLASQMTISNMQLRNAAVQDLNTAALVQQQRATNDTSAANEGSTWSTYLP